jgi:hypothetical protein
VRSASRWVEEVSRQVSKSLGSSMSREVSRPKERQQVAANEPDMACDRNSSRTSPLSPVNTSVNHVIRDKCQLVGISV